MSTDKDWEEWGSDNPYFGVLSDQKFLGSVLAPDVTHEFFESGVADINQVMKYIPALGASAAFDCAVDFGCGVGRLTVPLASYAKRAIGFDVSKSILDEARKILPAKAKKKVAYRVSDDSLENLPEKYDFVHSYITLQHIPPVRGEKIIKKLLSGLSEGGVAALHITFAYNAPLSKRLVISARNHFLPLHYLLNIVKGHPLTRPRMRMHLYNMNKTIEDFRKAGIPETIQLTTDHGGYIGVMIIGTKA